MPHPTLTRLKTTLSQIYIEACVILIVLSALAILMDVRLHPASDMNPWHWLLTTWDILRNGW